MATEHDPLIGTTFAGRYRIERRLGEGGMGCVYVATQLSMDRRVALKVLGEHMASSEAAVKRFHREMQATARVEHQNTIRVYDFGESDDGKLFLTMELLDGRTLHSVLHQHGALDTGRALHIAAQVARALGAAHHEGIVHRDLKPENIMLLDRYGEHDFVKVLDFGIARFAQGADPDDGEPAITKAGTLIGTPLYMSPEQALGKEIDGRSDLYALGVLLYQMTTGIVPFTDPTPVRVLFMHAHETPKAPSHVVPGRVPKGVEALIMRLLDKDPGIRPQTAADVVRALRESTEHATLVDGALAAGGGRDSKLTDSEEMIRARKRRNDPQSAIPTRAGSVTVDHDVDDTAPTTDSLVPVAPKPEPIVTAPTIAANVQDVAAVTAPTIAASAADVAAAGEPAPAATVMHRPVMVDTGQGDIDTGAHTMIAEPEPRAEPPEAPAAAPAAVPSPSPEPPPPAAPAPASRSKMPMVIVGVVIAIAAVAGVFAMGSGQDEPPTPEPPGKPALEARGAAEAPADPAKARATALRKELDDLATRAGDPATPAACRVAEAELLGTMVSARKKLIGGKPRGKRKQDRDAARELEALGTDDAEVQALLAKARLLGGLSDTETVAAANKAIGACPDLALAHGVVGAVHMLAGRAAQAEKSLGEALRLAGDFHRARFNLGLAAIRRKDAKAAVERLDRLLKDAPGHPRAHLVRGQARLLGKDFAGAIADLDIALQKSPKDKDAWLIKGLAHTGANQAAEANAAFCKATDLGNRRADKMCRR